MIEFVSYDGRYPNLCRGTLVLRIDGELVCLNHCLVSGGCVAFNDDWDEIVEQGEWSVDVPEEYKKYEGEITTLVNENIEYGCCGGCV